MESKTVRVLLVDDYEPWRRFVRSTLQKHSHLQIIGEVWDGLEAVQRAQELQPDLILMDIGLPKLGGIEAAHRIQRLAPSTKILFTSQNEDAEVVRAALSNGACGYVLKANANGELLPAIEAAMCGSTFVSSRLKRETYNFLPCIGLLTRTSGERDPL
jgi:DNA-binding NarL/FixJ family response regulator